MLNGNINIGGGGGDETALPRWNEPNENSNYLKKYNILLLLLQGRRH